MSKHRETLIALLACLLCGGGVSLAGEPDAQCIDAPVMWSSTLKENISSSMPVRERLSMDPTLDSLIDMALSSNFNVKAALARIESSKLALKQVYSSYYPSIGVSAGYSRSQQAGRIVGPNNPSTQTGWFSAGVNMSWEIDIFGRIKARASQSKIQTDITLAEYEAVETSLRAQIAESYINLREQQALANLMRKHISSQKRIVEITEVRHETGLSSELDVTQAQTVLYNTEASLPTIEANIQTCLYSLATLLGTYPSYLEWLLNTGEQAEMPMLAQSINPGVPADLLNSRPDLIEAAENVESAAAAVGISKQEWLPTLALSASVATESSDLKGLFGKNSLSWSVAPTLSWTVFDGLARNYATAQARMDLEAELDNFNVAMLSAVQEVNTAIADYNASTETTEYIKKAAEASSKSFDLSLDLYKKGLNPFTDVMNSQMSLLESESSLVSQRAATLIDLVNLWKALGRKI